MRFPSAKIYGYDTDKEAKRLCREMAIANGVSDRLFLGDFCSDETLLSMQFAGKALIISDCEGYEKQLFTPDVARFLALHDVLIEIHDLIDPAISSAIRVAFAQTHDILIVESIDDSTKVRTYNLKELAPYNVRERFSLLTECRGSIMEWFYCTPKRGH